MNNKAYLQPTELAPRTANRVVRGSQLDLELPVKLDIRHSSFLWLFDIFISFVFLTKSNIVNVGLEEPKCDMVSSAKAPDLKKDLAGNLIKGKLLKICLRRSVFTCLHGFSSPAQWERDAPDAIPPPSCIKRDKRETTLKKKESSSLQTADMFWRKVQMKREGISFVC